MNAPTNLHHLVKPQPKALNAKAMLVRLNISKPTTSRRDTQAEQFTQQSLHDAGLRVSATLFKEKTSPVRQLLNSANAVYFFHKQNTLPYIDRGPRLLPVQNYERYRDEMRKLTGEVEAALVKVMPDYAQHVANDVALRGSRASAAEYPTAEEFERSFKLQFTFSPLPDQSHWLFDIDEADKAALQTQLDEVIDGARADMYARLRDPVLKLIDKLRIPAGQPGSIFRDSAVSNITEAAALCRQLAMGDEDILAACDVLDQSVKHMDPEMLRESPVVREAAAARLAAVADKMKFMFGG